MQDTRITVRPLNYQEIPWPEGVALLETRDCCIMTI